MTADPARPGEAKALRAASILAAVLAVLLQAWPHWVDIEREQYTRGGAWEPRVKAILDVGRVALLDGPYLSLRIDRKFEPVDRRVNDLGYSVLSYGWARLTRQPLDRQDLMRVNLLVLLSALGALFLVASPWQRLLSAAVLCFVPIPLPFFRSPDPLATHGSLAVLGIALAGSAPRAAWLVRPLALGVALFLVHKIRSAYALYAGAALLASAGVEAWRSAQPAPLWRTLAVFAICLPLEAAWQIPLARRQQDPRLLDQDTLGTHPIYIALLEGIGFSENPWGIKPWDPWIATYLAERYRLDPVDVGSAESERRARRTYFELWRESPFAMLALYAGRVPAVCGQDVFAGVPGAVLLAAAGWGALAACWRCPRGGSLLALASLAMTLCVLFQTVVLDPRPLYAYPLRIVSGVSLAVCLGALLEHRFAHRARAS